MNQIAATEVALLHHLQAAAEPDGQLPKHVAHDLAQQGLVQLGEHSPGAASLTDRGRARLEQLQRSRAAADDIAP